LTGEILDKFSQLITTALGLVAALAWNDAIQTLFQQFLGSAGGALAAKIFYAVLVAIIVYVGSKTQTYPSCGLAPYWLTARERCASSE
jgi:hypothetical protein